MARKRRIPTEIHIRRFRRAAHQRLEEARFLLEKGRYTTAAVYLGGYAVECMLKALLLSRVPAPTRIDVLRSFKGTKAHDFDWLRGGLSQRGVHLPDEIKDCLSRVATWTTDLRYDPAEISLQRAEEFLADSERILGWIQGSI